MAQVDISINGRTYAVACDAGQEPRVRELAAMVDARVRQLAGQGASGIAETHFLVLASLTLADELSETKAALAASEAAEPPPAADLSDDEQELLVAAVDHLTERIAVIAERIEHA